MTERTKESCNTVMQKVLSDWNNGGVFKVSYREKSGTLDFYIISKIWEDCNCSDLKTYDITERFCAKPSEKDSALLSIYENLNKYNAGIRLIGKPGKIIKRIFPFMNPQEVETFVTWYKESFVQTNMGYQVKSGKEAKDFKFAYAGTQSPATDCNYDHNGIKSLSGSCMCHNFDDLPCHPAEVYASGDFTQYWIEDSQGRIASRCIVYNDKYAGPIYTNTNLATSMLKNHLEFLNIIDFDCEFVGAKINKVNIGNNYNSTYIIPFIDGIKYAESYSDDYWILTNYEPNCEYIETSQLGYSDTKFGNITCDCCGESFNEDSMACVNGGDCVCESCLSDNYQICENDGEYYLNRETVEVYYNTQWSIRSDSFHQNKINLVNAVYCENQDEYWRSDSVIYIESENIHVPTHLAKYDYFESTVDSIWYSNDQEVSTEIGDMTEEQAINADMTLINGVYMRVSEAYTVETTTNENGDDKSELILRDNYELDSDGIPQRNPDLFLYDENLNITSPILLLA